MANNLETNLMDVEINGEIVKRQIDHIAMSDFSGRHFSFPGFSQCQPVLYEGETVIWPVGSLIPLIIKVQNAQKGN